MWLGLEEVFGEWACGWFTRVDEATHWALMAEGVTPLAAAQALLAMIKEPTPGPPSEEF